MREEGRERFYCILRVRGGSSIAPLGVFIPPEYSPRARR